MTHPKSFCSCSHAKALHFKPELGSGCVLADCDCTAYTAATQVQTLAVERHTAFALDFITDAEREATSALKLARSAEEAATLTGVLALLRVAAEQLGGGK